MSRLFHRNPKSTPPLAVRGAGVYLYDNTGKAYLDASAGAAVSCLGHGHPAVLEAIHQQAESLAYAHTGFFTTEAAEALAEELVTAAPTGIDRVYLVSGGSEAIEAALKLARQYFWERGEVQRKYFIARRQSYHGNTLGALAVGGNELRREAFQPLLIHSHHIDPCYEYRYREAGETQAEYGVRAADLLAQKLQELGPENVIGFIAEPVVGATAGAVPAVPGYLQRIRQICDRYGILLILDEVMCGMGRTGSLYACEQDQVSADIVAIAKGLGAGYQPIGAMLCSHSIYQTLVDGSGFFQHSHTYLGHPMAAAAALAVQRIIREQGLLTQVKTRGDQLMAALHQAFSQHPYVGNIRGRGLFLGLEFVQDRTHKTPFAPDTELHKKLKAQAMAQGLMCYPMDGTIDGHQGHHVLLAPPFILESQHIDELVDKLKRALTQTLQAIGC